MKLKALVILCLAFSLLLCACGAPTMEQEEPNMNVGDVLEESVTDNTEEVPTMEETQPQQTETEPEVTEPETKPTNSAPVQPKPTEPEPTVPETTKAPVVVVKNEFFNDNNNFYENGQVNIRPRHMYWDGNVLVAQCFVINGMDKPVYNIEVQDLDFSNGNGLIADARFGVLQGVTLQPYTHVLWTFKFGSDTVVQSGADLSSISYHSSVSFDH